MNNFGNIRSALMQAVLDANLGLPLGGCNMPFEQPADAPWAYVHLLPSSTRGASLGPTGLDQHQGVLQVDINVLPGSGEEFIIEKCDVIASNFTTGKPLVYNAQEVTVRSCSRSKGRNVDGWYRISLSIEWYAQTPRL